MKLPNKVTSYEESILSKLTAILDLLSQKNMQIYELYVETRKQYSSYSDFVDTLDCLFALRKIEYLDNEEVLHYVA
jgi:hypothetical protein